MRKKNIKASLVNLTLNMRYTNDKKYQICHHQIHFFKLKMHQNPFSGLCAGPCTGGAYDAPPDLLVGWGGRTAGERIRPPHSPPRSTPSASRARRLRRLELGAYGGGTSVLRPPSTQNPGYASAPRVDC